MERKYKTIVSKDTYDYFVANGISADSMEITHAIEVSMPIKKIDHKHYMKFQKRKR